MLNAPESDRSPKAVTRSEVRLPGFLIIGAMRSGTTALSRYLRKHPDVFMSRPKEIHFFDANFDNGLDWYAGHFTEAGQGRLLGEATPFYMSFPETVDRMADTVPDARLVAILRNPIDRAYSHYWRYRSRGIETLDFGIALERETERMTSTTDHRFAYAALSTYINQIESVCARYHRDSLLVILFEDLVADPRGVYGTVCRFLGIRDDVVPSNLGKPANVYMSATKRSFLRKVKVPYLFTAVSRATKPATYPPMDPAIRSSLEERFRDPNAALARWLDRDLSIWNESTPD